MVTWYTCMHSLLCFTEVWWPLKNCYMILPCCISFVCVIFRIVFESGIQSGGKRSIISHVHSCFTLNQDLCFFEVFCKFHLDHKIYTMLWTTVCSFLIIEYLHQRKKKIRFENDAICPVRFAHIQTLLFANKQKNMNARV